MRHCDTQISVTLWKLTQFQTLNCHGHKMKPLPSDASHHAFLSISMKLESQIFLEGIQSWKVYWWKMLSWKLEQCHISGGHLLFKILGFLTFLEVSKQGEISSNSVNYPVLKLGFSETMKPIELQNLYFFLNKCLGIFLRLWIKYEMMKKWW